MHQRLIALQSDEELERKADKSTMLRGKLYTQEELDAADRQAMRWRKAFFPDCEVCGHEARAGDWICPECDRILHPRHGDDK